MDDHKVMRDYASYALLRAYSSQEGGREMNTFGIRPDILAKNDVSEVQILLGADAAKTILTDSSFLKHLKMKVCVDPKIKKTRIR